MKIDNPDITHAELLEQLHYDPLTGIFTWRIKPASKIRIGQPAGGLSHGYISIRITVRGRRHAVRAHRLAWFYMHAVWPTNEIDHRDNMRSNNSLKNLREATHQQNMCNRPLQPNNQSGAAGVHWDQRRQKWYAQIKIERKSKFLGRYTDIEQAIAARQAKALELHGEFTKI